RNQVSVGGGDSGGDKDERRAEYLAALLDTSVEGLGFNRTPSYTILWRGLTQFEAEIARARKEMGESYGRLLERLMEKNLLAESEASALKPQIRLRIFDYRENKSIPIPSQ